MVLTHDFQECQYTDAVFQATDHDVSKLSEKMGDMRKIQI